MREPPTPETGLPCGAYGLALALDAPEGAVAPIPASWTPWMVTLETATTTSAPAFLGADRARIPLESGGRLDVDRAAATARFTVHAPVPAAALLHPYLVPVAAIAAHWRGDVCFHAGAFVHRGRAWGVLAARDGGKSSLMASLARRGAAIVADDALVLRAGRVALAGPRWVDLRAEAASVFPGSAELGVVGERERCRLPVAGAPAENEFGGWIALSWGDGPPSTSTVGLPTALQLLTASLTLRTPPASADALLEAATHPMLAFARPRDWSAIDAGINALLAAIDRLCGEPGALQQ